MPQRRDIEPSPLRVFFLLRSLDRGGAQRQLIELVKGLDPAKFKSIVCTFYDGGVLRDELAGTRNIELISLEKSARWDVLPFLARLERAVAAARPHVIHGYMPVANELALLASRRFGVPCIWGLRASNMRLAEYGAMPRAVFWGGGVLSRFADRIIVNSEAGRAHYVGGGYSPRRMVVISNGIDGDRFHVDADARQRLRSAWQIPEGVRLVGHVGRLDPMKDHETLLAAAALVAKAHPSARFVCVGGDPIPRYAAALVAKAEQLGVPIHWAGDRSDINDVYNALDIFVLSSAFGEGFPNVVGEAMAASKPCVVTHVGDAARVVGETGIVVPPRDADKLAAAISHLLSQSDADLVRQGKAARARVESQFSIAALINATERVLENVRS